MTPSKLRKKYGIKRVTAGTLVSPKESEKMYKVYRELGSYAATAKVCYRDATTVARHVKIHQALNEEGVF